MRALESISAVKLPLPISERSRLVMASLRPPSGLQIIGQLFEPSEQRVHGFDAGPRLGRLTDTDLDRQATAAIDGAEAVLVGDVVADIDGRAAGERRLVQELFD